MINETIYQFAILSLLLLTIGLIIAALFGLNYAFRKLHIVKTKRDLLVRYIGLGLALWLTILGMLAHYGFFSNFEQLPPKIIVVIIPPIILIFLLLRSRFFKLILRAIPEKWLILIQSFRILMELFLWMCFLGGFVPFQMTFEGLNQDMMIGITALMAGFFFFYKGRRQQTAAIYWNISGIILLINIVIISIISTPSPFRVFMNEPSSYFIADFPFIWIPGFIVPFALAMHLFSIKQLMMNGKKN